MAQHDCDIVGCEYGVNHGNGRLRPWPRLRPGDPSRPCFGERHFCTSFWRVLQGQPEADAVQSPGPESPLGKGPFTYPSGGSAVPSHKGFGPRRITRTRLRTARKTTRRLPWRGAAGRWPGGRAAPPRAAAPAPHHAPIWPWLPIRDGGASAARGHKILNPFPVSSCWSVRTCQEDRRRPYPRTHRCYRQSPGPGAETTAQDVFGPNHRRTRVEAHACFSSESTALGALNFATGVSYDNKLHQATPHRRPAPRRVGM